LQEQIDEENRCNGELESYLKNAIAKMKNMTDFWNEKSDRETIEKQTDLDKLKTMRAKDLERYQSLLKTVIRKFEINLKFCLLLWYFSLLVQ